MVSAVPEYLPRMPFKRVSGCSWISLSMKCLNVPLAAVTGSSESLSGDLVLRSPSDENIWTSVGRISTISSDSRKINSWLYGSNAERSEATRDSSSPIPITSPPAFPTRAPTSRSGCWLSTARNEYAPLASDKTSWTALTRSKPASRLPTSM